MRGGLADEKTKTVDRCWYEARRAASRERLANVANLHCLHLADREREMSMNEGVPSVEVTAACGILLFDCATWAYTIYSCELQLISL